MNFRVCTHAAFQDQLMVQLTWQTKQIEGPYSKVSEQLIYELKQFGLVNYSIWNLPDNVDVD